MAYLCNKHYGYTALNKVKMGNKDPVYGDGFRLVNSADKGKGFPDIKKWLKSGEYKKDLIILKKKQLLEKKKKLFPKGKSSK
jgi:hypothetical protein